MGIIAWIVLGLIAGWIASMIMGTNSQQGMLADIVLGVLGAVMGGFLVSTLLGGEGITGLNLSSIVVAVIGAALLIGLRRAFIRS